MVYVGIPPKSPVNSKPNFLTGGFAEINSTFVLQKKCCCIKCCEKPQTIDSSLPKMSVGLPKKHPARAFFGKGMTT